MPFNLAQTVTPEQQAGVLTGGGQIVRDYVGAMMPISAFSFYSLSNPADIGYPADFVRPGAEGRKSEYFYFDRDKGAAASRGVGNSYDAIPTIRIDLPTASILNMAPEDAEKITSGVISFKVAQATVGKPNAWAKKRHPLHLFYLPSLVDAVAVAMGLYPTSLFDTSYLTDPKRQAEVMGWSVPHANIELDDAEYQGKLIGSDQVDPSQSIYWKMRAAIWAALGEPDPTKYTYNLTNDKGEPITRTNTASDKLGAILMLYQNRLAQPLWAHVRVVDDPLVTATYDDAQGNKRRERIPVVVAVFGNADEARAYGIQRGLISAEDTPVKPVTVTTTPAAPVVQAQPVTAAPTNGNKPALPDAWKQFAAQWQSQVTAIKSALLEQVPPPARATIFTAANYRELLQAAVAKVGNGSDIGATLDEVDAWVRVS